MTVEPLPINEGMIRENQIVRCKQGSYFMANAETLICTIEEHLTQWINFSPHPAKLGPHGSPLAMRTRVDHRRFGEGDCHK
jgi:hypothetical protein